MARFDVPFRNKEKISLTISAASGGDDQLVLVLWVLYISIRSKCADVLPAFLPEQEVRQRVLQGRPAFRKFNFYTDPADAKAVWIFYRL